ncbi:ABC transporter [Halalkalibacillus sediminis]|uniref:ABC transporter n=1 Tax=Halalkalibacillus sediminis TaxID=2018042 RepID=A0A2I0QTE5_9BACI|nr:ABC transporter ATP-binding protein [Halalkalibacillus sediminis]PKR77613.1 ABC transporter [Halalkalibacillus sediminis]
MTVKIEAQHISLNYKGFKALKDISFSIEGGKIIGLIGRNGAGKTSLLSIISAFQYTPEGSLRVNGEEVFENAKVMRDIAFLYDADYSDQTENVKDMLDTVKKYRPYYDEEYAMHLVKRFKLPLDKAANKLSKGMQSALNVTMGLASRAPITIFDEVYLGMDAPTRNIFYKELLEDQEKHPRTFILSTHLVSEMDYLFDEIVMIHDGKLLLHENYGSLVEKGVSVTGHHKKVDEFVENKEILNEEKLGTTKSVTIFGELSEEELEFARKDGLEIGPVSLQDLFIHLTGGEE